MRRSLVIVWYIILLAACVPTHVPASPIPTPSPQNQLVDLMLSDVVIRLQHISGWVLYQDEKHIVLTEEINPLNHQGNLDGIVMHLWLAEMATDDTIVGALHHILQKSEMKENTVFSNPKAFIWQKHESAYYLLNTDDTTIALVLVIRLPDSMQMLAVNISAPFADYARMRQMLPTLFTGFAVNNQLLNYEDLQNLPIYLDETILSESAQNPRTTPNASD